jgi:hypothetical protein
MSAGIGSLAGLCVTESTGLASVVSAYAATPVAEANSSAASAAADASQSERARCLRIEDIGRKYPQSTPPNRKAGEHLQSGRDARIRLCSLVFSGIRRRYRPITGPM